LFGGRAVEVVARRTTCVGRAVAFTDTVVVDAAR
jgi:hypothetical protein